MKSRPRLFYLDLVRAVALVSILIIHFNASVTGYFTFPSKLFASWLPGGIYLGDFGSSLFFLVSGAALMYTAKTPFSVVAFYKKRALAVYPMFWLAWLLCFSIRFISQPAQYSAVKSVTLVLTAVGLDNFAVAAQWVSADFACVGEWFLGSILFLYLLFPLLKRLLEKSRLLAWGLALPVCLLIHFCGWDHQMVAIHVLEFLFGMTFVGLKKQPRVVSWLCLLVWPACFAVTRVATVDEKTICALVSTSVFVFLAGTADFVAVEPVRRVCAGLSKYSYAVFLVHHVLILRMVQQFDLSAISRRETVLLLMAYFVAVAAAAVGLFSLEKAVRRVWRSIFAKADGQQTEPAQLPEK